MELVPIIFTTLKIVLVIAILVIGFSYVSYKIKLKRGTIVLPGKGLTKTGEITEKSVKKIINRITKPLPPPEPLLQNPLFKEEVNNPQQKSKQKETHKKNPKESKHASNSERIEIVKSLTPKSSRVAKNQNDMVNDTSKEKTSAQDKNVSSLGDKILDKYSEDDINEMYTLNTKKKDSNKKK
jgi:hypothetical protein